MTKESDHGDFHSEALLNIIRLAAGPGAAVMNETQEIT
jgi:hypothetical protein